MLTDSLSLFPSLEPIKRATSRRAHGARHRTGDPRDPSACALFELALLARPASEPRRRPFFCFFCGRLVSTREPLASVCETVQPRMSDKGTRREEPHAQRVPKLYDLSPHVGREGSSRKGEERASVVPPSPFSILQRDILASTPLPDSFLEIISGGQQLKTSDPSAFLLSPSQMFEQNYPTPTTRPPSSSSAPAPASTTPTTTTFEDWKRPDGWIEAPYVPLQGDAGTLRKVFGLDCEMVRKKNLSYLTETLEGIPI